MAYSLTFWKVIGKDAADQLKEIRLKSVEEVFSLSLPHNRPKDCDAIVLERSDDPMGRSYKGHYDKLVWANEKGKTCEVIPSVAFEPSWLTALDAKDAYKIQLMPDDLKDGEWLTVHEVDGQMEMVFLNREGKTIMMVGAPDVAPFVEKEVDGQWANRMFAVLATSPNWEITTEPLR